MGALGRFFAALLRFGPLCWIGVEKMPIPILKLSYAFAQSFHANGLAEIS
jgi:hypothetical protein